MRRSDVDLLLLVGGAVAVIVVILAFPLAQTARILLGLPFILFFPGYSLIAALFPDKGDLNAPERIALSLGLSIATVPLIGLALNYSPWGIRLYPLLAFITLFIVLASAVAVFRRRLLPGDEAFGITIRIQGLWRSQARTGSGLLTLALVPLAAGVGIAGYLVTGAQGGGQRFTEFYLLGPDGTAGAYPRLLRAGENTTLTLGLVNHEGKDTSYRIVARIAGEETSDLDNLRLADSQGWEKAISLVPSRVGDQQKVEFLLYKDGGSEPYRVLHLWLDVKGAIPGREARPAPRPVLSLPSLPEATEVLTQEQPGVPAREEPNARETPQARVHLVAPGENLTRIARRYGVPLEAVIAANQLENPDLIYPQQEILIPATSPARERE